MRYLLDTHVFIWTLLDTKKLTSKVYDIIEADENEVFISPISFWEIAIKYQNKKLNLGKLNPLHLPHIAEQFDFELLNPEPYDYVSISTVPQKENHHDPVDRMIIQQAIRNNLVLISADEKFKQYEENGLQLLW